MMVWNGKNGQPRMGGRIRWSRRSLDDLRDGEGRGLDVGGLELETAGAMDAPAGGGHRSGEAVVRLGSPRET